MAGGAMTKHADIAGCPATNGRGVGNWKLRRLIDRVSALVLNRLDDDNQCRTSATGGTRRFSPVTHPDRGPPRRGKIMDPDIAAGFDSRLNRPTLRLAQSSERDPAATPAQSSPAASQ